MNTTRTYYEYVTVTYNPNNTEEDAAVDALMDDQSLEFRSRRPQGQNLVLTMRREIKPPEMVNPIFDPVALLKLP